jgi:hypothetical protein
MLGEGLRPKAGLYLGGRLVVVDGPGKLVVVVDGPGRTACVGQKSELVGMAPPAGGLTVGGGTAVGTVWVSPNTTAGSESSSAAEGFSYSRLASSGVGISAGRTLGSVASSLGAGLSLTTSTFGNGFFLVHSANSFSVMTVRVWRENAGLPTEITPKIATAETTAIFTFFFRFFNIK